MVALGCGPVGPTNAVRPARRGAPAVFLLPVGHHYVPLACHDPLWGRLRGPADCADLIPSGARAAAGGARPTLGDREPFDCAWSPGVAFATEGPAPGFAMWPPDADIGSVREARTRPLPDPPPWPAHTRAGWRARLDLDGFGDYETVWALDLGGFGGLFVGDPPRVIDHFAEVPDLVGTLDLDGDGRRELLLTIGRTWAVYEWREGRLVGIAGCVMPAAELSDR